MNEQSMNGFNNVHTGDDIPALRQTLGCFPTGVTIVATRDKAGTPIGLTVSSFNSVSLNPPLIVWSLQLSSAQREIFRSASGYAITVLAQNQTDLCRIFASDIPDRFDGVEWTETQTGMPIISGSAAWFDCAAEARYPGGDHDIFVGRVLSHAKTESPPMVYANGQLASLKIEEF